MVSVVNCRVYSAVVVTLVRPTCVYTTPTCSKTNKIAKCLHHNVKFQYSVGNLLTITNLRFQNVANLCRGVYRTASLITWSETALHICTLIFVFINYHNFYKTCSKYNGISDDAERSRTGIVYTTAIYDPFSKLSDSFS